MSIEMHMPYYCVCVCVQLKCGLFKINCIHPLVVFGNYISAGSDDFPSYLQ
jgi:hypothetical protein